jgi:hypothetical protein
VPTPFDVEEHTRIIVRQLLAKHGIRNRELVSMLRAEPWRIHITEQALSDRLRTPWTSDKPQPPFRQRELYALATIFDVNVGLFFGPAELQPVLSDPTTDHPMPQQRIRNKVHYYGPSVVSSDEPELILQPA